MTDYRGVATINETGEILFVPANIADMKFIHIGSAGVFGKPKEDHQNSQIFCEIVRKAMEAK